MSTVDGFHVGNEVVKYNYEKLENYNTPEFSTSATYAVGDYVMYDGKLYKCKTAITTASAWDVSKWDLAILSDDVSDLSNDFDSLDVAVNTYLLGEEVSPNIYDPSTDTDGVQLANAGYTYTNSNYNTSDYIDISGLEAVYIAAHVGTGLQAIKVCYYNSSKTNIADTWQSVSIGTGSVSSANDTLYALTIPQNAKYLRFHYYNSDVTKIYIGGFFSPYVYVAYGTSTVVLPSDETKEARGNYLTLNDRLNAISDAVGMEISTVEYWGDSLTAGNQDSSGKSRSSFLRELLGDSWVIKNYGVGGEGSNAVSARASGIYAVITPDVTIPADGSAVDLTGHLEDIFGNTIGFGYGIYSELYSQWVTVNPCYVDGVQCILQRTNSSSPITIKRVASGEAVNITRPTYIVMNSTTLEKNSVLMICIGQNEGFDRDADELIAQIEGIIKARGASRYIVFGLPHAMYGYTWEAEFNEKLKTYYGKNYYDIESYMKTPVKSGGTIISSYALQDAGITPTESDLTAIAQDQYPPSIMYDSIHFNQYGYKVWADREYLIGKWLGYWN